jgi:hypothetical protein
MRIFLFCLILFFLSGCSEPVDRSLPTQSGFWIEQGDSWEQVELSQGFLMSGNFDKKTLEEKSVKVSRSLCRFVANCPRQDGSYFVTPIIYPFLEKGWDRYQVDGPMMLPCLHEWNNKNQFVSVLLLGRDVASDPGYYILETNWGYLLLDFHPLE